ncbi:Mysoin-binding motif of peroxisomes-domain-containing protein [Mycotypha africana]|uniref:Mysoin-binding motif of peroxisomes-domain-containing protein n=1 Tax=Mycotypha africana TaxID=64632 RepID=UPI0023008791|nr:Mysoin-binding motif of peroxisomes-domain-containing protein [Mycotypha africana]KAI8979615.1 Mysoin-binding motif of peroxisomes-domain-containing protein [Mycotypha africana]
MTEFVVYEDSPLADYLQSVNQAEKPVKITVPPPSSRPPLTRPSVLTKTSDRSLDISKMWRRSLFFDTFSISLPRAEENAFEEKFKYLVISSPLLSEMLTIQHHHHHKRSLSTELLFQLPPQGRKWRLATNLITPLSIVLGIEYYGFKPKIPVVTLFLSSSVTVFFLYRHRRRTIIRQLYQNALSQLQTFTEQSDVLNNKIQKVLITIQEIELVSRGYRLSTPLSPISRIEQSSGRHKKCRQLRNTLASILRRAFIAYEEGVIDLIDVINRQNLSTLYDMYNVHSIATLSAMGGEPSSTDKEEETEPYSLDQLKKLAQLMHLKRRECMVHLLALNGMAEDEMYQQKKYEYDRHGWAVVNNVLSKLVQDTEQFVRDTVDALEVEFQRPWNGSQPRQKSLLHKITDTRTKQFVHRLSSLEQHIRTMEAKLYLCNDNVRQLSSDPSNDEWKEKLRHDYLSIQQEFQMMTAEWDLGKDTLETFLNPPDTASLAPTEEEKVPPKATTEASLEETEGKGMILDAEDVADILNLPPVAKASVFEAIAGVVEKNGKERSKKTRQERIEEMRMRRAKESEERLANFHSQTMVHELKSVLHRRVTELDLADDDHVDSTVTTQ